jgi:hypothetical protein
MMPAKGFKPAGCNWQPVHLLHWIQRAMLAHVLHAMAAWQWLFEAFLFVRCMLRNVQHIASCWGIVMVLGFD